jgi:4-aminobutyrate aminotransferase-like enzyme
MSASFSKLPQLAKQTAVVLDVRGLGLIVVDHLVIAQPLRTEREDVPIAVDLVEAHVLLPD